MTTNYPLALFHWRRHADPLDGSHPRSTIKTLLWACEQWQEKNHDALGSVTGCRLGDIKAELNAWLDQYG
jgi:hypothetical protein